MMGLGAGSIATRGVAGGVGEGVVGVAVVAGLAVLLVCAKLA